MDFERQHRDNIEMLVDKYGTKRRTEIEELYLKIRGELESKTLPTLMGNIPFIVYNITSNKVRKALAK